MYRHTAQTLLLDADDTLWENNVYFERSIAEFIDILNHQHFTRKQVREVLNEVERECIGTHGYGCHSFARALLTTFERLHPQPITAELHQRIAHLGHRIADHPLEIIAGVPETLEELGSRHELILLTKGNNGEQVAKVERSGLQRYFAEVEVVAEKNADTYRDILKRHGLNARSTWMVGNSPRSDINPSLVAGLHAVFVPHDNTWILEHEELAAPQHKHQHLLKLERFTQLTEYF